MNREENCPGSHYMDGLHFTLPPTTLPPVSPSSSSLLRLPPPAFIPGHDRDFDRVRDVRVMGLWGKGKIG